MAYVPLTAQMVEIFRDLLARRTALLSTIGPKTLAPSSDVFSDDPAGLAWLRPDSADVRMRQSVANPNCHSPLTLLTGGELNTHDVVEVRPPPERWRTHDHWL